MARRLRPRWRMGRGTRVQLRFTSRVFRSWRRELMWASPTPALECMARAIDAQVLMPMTAMDQTLYIRNGMVTRPFVLAGVTACASDVHACTRRAPRGRGRSAGRRCQAHRRWECPGTWLLTTTEAPTQLAAARYAAEHGYVNVDNISYRQRRAAIV